jgi:hypothetical protein
LSFSPAPKEACDHPPLSFSPAPKETCHHSPLSFSPSSMTDVRRFCRAFTPSDLSSGSTMLLLTPPLQSHLLTAHDRGDAATPPSVSPPLPPSDLLYSRRDESPQQPPHLTRSLDAVVTVGANHPPSATVALPLPVCHRSHRYHALLPSSPPPPLKLASARTSSYSNTALIQTQH